MIRAALLLLLVLPACGESAGPGGGNPGGRSSRPLAPRHLALVTRFAKAIVAKDYAAAFDEMAADYRTRAGRETFERSAKRYREAAGHAPAFAIEAGEDDPRKIREGLAEFFVPADVRGRIVEEAVIHFAVKEDDGSWACYCWIADDPGGPRILQFAQDD